MIIPTPIRIRRFTDSVRLLILAGALSLLASNAHAQAVWTNADDRNPYEGDPNNYFPLWSYGKVVDDKGNVIHVGNWSGNLVPGQGGPVDVYLGAPGNTNLDVQASLTTLTLAPGGGLNMLGSTRLSVTNTNLATDGTITNIGGTGFYPSYTNAGTLVKSAGTGTFTFDPPIAFVSLPGSVIKVNSGALLLSGHGGVIDTVTFDPAAGTLIDLVPASGFSFFQGTLTNGTGTGTVRLSQGTMGGTDANFVANPQPCTFAFTGNVFQWTGGLIGFDQRNSPFINTGVMNISGDGTKETDAIFTNRGLVTQSGAGQFNVSGGNNGGSFTNAAGATYDLRSDANVGQDGYPFNNAGLFKKSGGTGTSTLSVSFNNQGGTVEVDSGTLQMPLPNNTFNNSSTSTGGTFNVAAGALLDLGDGTVFTGTYTGGGGGTIRFSQGALYTSSATAATFNFPGPMFQWTGGYIGGGQRGHLFTNAGTLNISGDSDKASFTVFTNTGTIIQTGKGSLGVGQGNNGGNITNAAGATYNLASDAIAVSGNPFTNAGLLEKTAGTGTSTMDVEFTNTGTVAVNTGTLNFTQRVNAINGTTLTGGTWSVADGATLSFQYYPSLTVNQANVSLSGVNTSFPAILSLADNQGTFALLAQRQFTTVGALTNEGTLSLDAGSTLHVGGSFTASGANPTLAVTIGGTASQGFTSPGVLQANGVVTLAGSLSLQFATGAALPGSGDTLAIISGTSVVGSFANVINGERLTTTDGRGSFQVNYGPNSAQSKTLVVLSQFVAQGGVSHPAFFSAEVALSQGVYYLAFPGTGNIFGYYAYLSDPNYIYHFDLGFEYVFDAADGRGGVYFYDFTSSDFFYTSPSFPFPYLYDFNLKAVLYYYPDPTNPQRYNTNGVRYFYNISTGQIISK